MCIKNLATLDSWKPVRSASQKYISAIGTSAQSPVRLLGRISVLLRAALSGTIAPILVTHAGVPGVDQGQGAYPNRAPQEDLPKCSSSGPL